MKKKAYCNSTHCLTRYHSPTYTPLRKRVAGNFIEQQSSIEAERGKEKRAIGLASKQASKPCVDRSGGNFSRLVPAVNKAREQKKNKKEAKREGRKREEK